MVIPRNVCFRFIQCRSFPRLSILRDLSGIGSVVIGRWLRRYNTLSWSHGALLCTVSRCEYLLLEWRIDYSVGHRRKTRTTQTKRVCKVVQGRSRMMGWSDWLVLVLACIAQFVACLVPHMIDGITRAENEPIRNVLFSEHHGCRANSS
jgi:hypothetical protein